MKHRLPAGRYLCWPRVINRADWDIIPEGLLPTVQPQVSLKVVLEPEAQATGRTGERFFS